METRFLGNSGLKVSALAFGTMTFGGKGQFRQVGSAARGPLPGGGREPL
jgi:aryl-alcohol dehydrogenase-like predicted oxidoreductase